MQKIIYSLVFWYVMQWNVIFAGQETKIDGNTSFKSDTIVKSDFYTPDSSPDRSPSSFGNKTNPKIDIIMEDTNKLFRRTQRDYEAIRICFEKIKDLDEKFNNLAKKIERLYSVMHRETDRRLELTKTIQHLNKDVSDIKVQEYTKKRSLTETLDNNELSQNSESSQKRQRI